MKNYPDRVLSILIFGKSVKIVEEICKSKHSKKRIRSSTRIYLSTLGIAQEISKNGLMNSKNQKIPKKIYMHLLGFSRRDLESLEKLCSSLLFKLVYQACWSSLLIKLVDRSCWSSLLIKLAAQACWSSLLDRKSVV